MARDFFHLSCLHLEHRRVTCGVFLAHPERCPLGSHSVPAADWSRVPTHMFKPQPPVHLYLEMGAIREVIKVEGSEGWGPDLTEPVFLEETPLFLCTQSCGHKRSQQRGGCLRTRKRGLNGTEFPGTLIVTLPPEPCVKIIFLRVCCPSVELCYGGLSRPAQS